MPTNDRTLQFGALKRAMQSVASLALFLVACYGADSQNFGSKTVATKDCREPQTSYHRNNVSNLDQLQLAAFRAHTDDSKPADFVVQCADFALDCEVHHDQAACDHRNSPGYYTLGTNLCRVDHGQAQGEFSFSGVENHVLIHAYITQGPHPEMARLHICPCGVTLPDCWKGGCGTALMNPGLSGLGPSTTTFWNGDTERIDVGVITLNTPTDLDRKFVQEAMRR